MTDSLPNVTFKRVMLKISGEALMGDLGFGLHPPTVQRIANEVKTVHDLGVEICMVIGGGCSRLSKSLAFTPASFLRSP